MTNPVLNAGAGPAYRYRYNDAVSTNHQMLQFSKPDLCSLFQFLFFDNSRGLCLYGVWVRDRGIFDAHLARMSGHPTVCHGFTIQSTPMNRLWPAMALCTQPTDKDTIGEISRPLEALRKHILHKITS